MKHARRDVLLAFWLVLQLLLGQQLALAHMVGHVGAVLNHAATGAAVGAGGEDDGHGGAASLTHVCTTCASCPGIDMLPGGGQSARFDSRCGDHALPGAVAPAPTFGNRAAFRSRAPPLPQA